MPNKIKYSVSNLPYSLRIKNVTIGAEDSEYGPTDNGIVIPNIDVSSTRTFWWNGITPQPSGYTIYQVKTDGSSPSIMCPVDDAAVIYWANSMGGSGINTVGDAIEYINSVSNEMIIVNKDYPSIVTSGLTFAFDSSFTPSYPRVNNSWFDISGNNNNSTLYNTPSFTNSTETYLSFNPNTYQYAETGVMSDLNTWTIESRFRVTSSLTGQISSIISNQWDMGTKLNFSMGTNNAPSNYNLTIGFFDGGWRNLTGFVPVQNQWYHLVGTYDGSTLSMYIDGVLFETLSYVGTPMSGGTVRIARRWDDANNLSVNFFPADIHFVRIYNRALSLGEVLQNYNNLF